MYSKRQQLPWCVTAVGYGHVANPKFIEHAQVAQTAVNKMASL